MSLPTSPLPAPLPSALRAHHLRVLWGLAALALGAAMQVGAQVPSDVGPPWWTHVAWFLLTCAGALAVGARRGVIRGPAGALAGALLIVAVTTGGLTPLDRCALVLMSAANGGLALIWGRRTLVGFAESDQSAQADTANSRIRLMTILVCAAGAIATARCWFSGGPSNVAVLWGLWTLSSGAAGWSSAAPQTGTTSWFSSQSGWAHGLALLAWTACAFWQHQHSADYGNLVVCSVAACGFWLADACYSRRPPRASAADRRLKEPTEQITVLADWMLPVVAVFPWRFWTSVQQGRAPVAADWLVMLASCATLIGASCLWRRYSLGRSAGAARDVAASGLWMLLAAGAVIAWPPDIRPWPVSFSVWLAIAALLGGLLLVAAAIGGRSAAAALIPALQFSMLAVAAVAAIGYVVASRPHLGGVDFFYYLCYSRDMAAGAPVSPECYRYFPGVFFVWRNYFSWFAPTLSNAQTLYAGILLANGALTGWLVWRSVRSLAAALYAAVWCLILLSRFQGLAGVTEPLSTLPMLAGLIIWNGGVLRGRVGLVRALCLGVAIGLSLYCKQQAGLLSLGFLACLIAWPRTHDQQRHALWQLILLPAVAAVTCGGLLLLEGASYVPGQPWLPLRQGLMKAASYPSEGGIMHNYYVLLRTDETAAAAGVGLVLGCVWATVRYPSQSWARLLGWLGCAWAATLVQFLSRPYGHYALLGAPLLAAGATLAAWCWWRQTTLTDSVLLRSAATMILALPLCYVTTDVAAQSAWRLGHRVTAPLWHQHPDTAADLQQLRAWIHPGDRLYVAPSRHAESYWFLGARAAADTGYSFQSRATVGEPWRSAPWVLVITGRLDEADEQWWPPSRREALEQQMQEAGWRLVLELSTVRLYQAPPG